MGGQARCGGLGKFDPNNPEGMAESSPGFQSGVKGRSNQTLSPVWTIENIFAL
jgi:hypothetical protein